MVNLPISILCQERLRLYYLFPLAVGFLGKFYEFGVITFRLRKISRKRCSFTGAIEAAKTVRVLFSGSFEFLKRIRRSFHLEQQLAEQLSRRHEAAWSDRMLLAFIFQVRG